MPVRRATERLDHRLKVWVRSHTSLLADHLTRVGLRVDRTKWNRSAPDSQFLGKPRTDGLEWLKREKRVRDSRLWRWDRSVREGRRRDRKWAAVPVEGLNLDSAAQMADAVARYGEMTLPMHAIWAVEEDASALVLMVHNSNCPLG